MKRKLYLNADGQRQRIVPMWCDAMWQRKLWCFFHGHKQPCSVTTAPNSRTVCGICGKVLISGPTIEELNPNDKNWLWNGEPVTWYEFCDRLEGKK